MLFVDSLNLKADITPPMANRIIVVLAIQCLNFLNLSLSLSLCIQIFPQYNQICFSCEIVGSSLEIILCRTSTIFL